ncbi:allophanate hydrolase [Roseomonas sp. NAR14]|uniref:Allophanate hydrolase n=1 Tax=Roseomonas acroporae TaxID=2937791 RepID=A0A9X2BZ31_9PROT|nr:allophanate hydrolase [Roseomonas acroporae]MCK8786630.1 allophanate hydrolase [Roseomonas acroporae]
MTNPPAPPAIPTLPAIAAYLAAGGSPVALAEAALDRIAAWDDPALFIAPLPREAVLARARQLAAEGPRGRPLYGVPFVVKDNIDLAGLPTTAACPEYAYTPAEDAPAVARLLAAGAIPLGKANLDQFATGLNGTRSPYGTPRNALDPALIPGGSSSGSATAVGAGIAAFSLGTDTAGSGRVPAMLNNIVGLKPSLGLVPTRGVVPACRSLDCVSVFALTVADAAAVLAVIAGPDPADRYARPAPAGWSPLPGARPPVTRLAIPETDQLAFDTPADAALFAAALARAEALGARIARVDLAPFLALARRLYEGAWVAERTAALRGFLETRPDAVHPVTRGILEAGFRGRTVDAFDDFHAAAEARRLARDLFAAHDLLLVPTAPGAPTLADLAAEPIAANSRLGTYTNFVNIADLSGLAIPAGFRPDGRPFGVTLLAPAFAEARLGALGAALHAALDAAAPAGTPPPGLGAMAGAVPAPPAPPPLRADETALFCIGAHMAGLPLNPQVTALGGRFLAEARTAPCYRLYDLGARPGLLRVAPRDRPGDDAVAGRRQAGAAIAGELWALPTAAIGALLAQVPAPLGFGRVALAEGEALGFLCEAAGIEGAPDITATGGWRAYLTEKEPA